MFNKDRDSSRGRTAIDRRTSRDAKRKLPAERHGELLAKAVEIAQAEGLSAVTLRRVATDLGVTPGLVSHYFSAAEQLITAAFRTAAVADLDEAQIPRRGGVERRRAKMDALMDYVLDEPGDDASALWLEAWSLGRRNAALAAEAKDLTDRVAGVHRRRSWRAASTAVSSPCPTSRSRRGGC